MSRIEQIINEIEEYIDSCKYQPLSNSKIVVNKEEMEELLVELRMRVPDEIKKYQKIIGQQDAILEEARTQAQNMINDAQSQIDDLVSDHEVMQRAYQRANEVVEEARQQGDAIVAAAVDDANNIRQGAMQYADGLLANIQEIISGSAGESKQRFDQMFISLQHVYDECTDSRSQLQIPQMPQQPQQPAAYDGEVAEQ